jgi:hypothetical protein
MKKLGFIGIVFMGLVGLFSCGNPEEAKVRDVVTKFRTAIQELDLAKNPNKSSLSAGKSIEVKGIDGLSGTFQVLGVLSPETNPNRVMAVKIDATSVPSSYVNIPNGNQNRFYANDAKSVGKLIIK